jgi:mono/diheme cytochrome c family protein
MFRNKFVRVVLILVAIFLVIQLIPFGKDHTNPPVVAEPNWNSPQTRALAQRACFDCHSNQTVWPWYSNVAPVSWLLAVDVQEGRQNLNFSDINGVQRAARGEGGDEISRVIQNGEMPPFYYILQHTDAKLTGAEKQQLIQGLQASLAQR